jgi:hypothetical protein
VSSKTAWYWVSNTGTLVFVAVLRHPILAKLINPTANLAQATSAQGRNMNIADRILSVYLSPAQARVPSAARHELKLSRRSCFIGDSSIVA